ncbi:MAG: hypothetical protein SVW02_00305 [Candidatus Nanohaloarchaea archaeon]|nr:hypothetical protein [Candidatus Nanohaloarchaea archaeon]
MSHLREAPTYLALVVAGIVTGGVIDTAFLGYRVQTLVAPFSILLGVGVPAYYLYLVRGERGGSPRRKVFTRLTILLAILAVGLAVKSIITIWSPVVT